MLRMVTFEGEEVVIRGYVVHPTMKATVNLALLPNNFFPTLSHKESDIERKIIHRPIEVPSLRTLRHSGYDVDQAVVVAEIIVHPKHIKNHNFMRYELPEIFRKVAKRHHVLLIIPNIDIPAARYIRKDFLSVLRGAGFPPLYINGKRYTSGYLKFFAVFPDDESHTGWRKKMGVREDAIMAYKKTSKLLENDEEVYGHNWSRKIDKSREEESYAFDYRFSRKVEGLIYNVLAAEAQKHKLPPPYRPKVRKIVRKVRWHEALAYDNPNQLASWVERNVGYPLQKAFSNVPPLVTVIVAALPYVVQILARLRRK